MSNSDNKINISSTWKPMGDIPIDVSSDFKTAKEAYINIGDTWKQWWFDIPWLGTWAKRVEITISNTNVDSSQTHFPLPIFLGTSVGTGADDLSSVFDEVGANSLKIAVTKDDAETELYVEVQEWDDSGETAVIWVSKSDWTISSSATTTIYLYYDNTESNNTSYVAVAGSRTEVWDSNFDAVWHLSENGDGTADEFKDSINVNHGQGVGVPTQTSNGKVGHAQNFNGSSDYITMGDVLSHGGNDPVTYSAWIKTGGAAEYAICSKAHHTTFQGTWFLMYQGYFEPEMYDSAGKSKVINTDSNSYNDDEWYHFVYTYDGSDADGMTLYVDGSVPAFSIYLDEALGTVENSFPFNIAATNDGQGSFFFPGIIDEVRVSDTNRTAANIKLDYHSQSDNVLSFGSEEAL